MNPPTCRFCKKSEWSHRCGLDALTGVAAAPTESPKTKAAAKIKARKAGKK